MKKTILYLLLGLLIGSSIYTNISINASIHALQLWFQTLLPSFLFPLIIIRLISPYHLLYPFLKPFQKIIKVLFNMDINAFECICTSLFLGFPSTSIILEEHALKLSKKAYERFLYIPFMASPSFILVTLTNIYNQKSVYMLFLIQVLSIFILLFINRKTYISFPLEMKYISFSSQLSYSIKSSFDTLLLILANLLLVFVSIDLITLYLPELAKTSLKLLSEFASGCFYIGSLHLSYKIKMLFTSILLSYGGLCVHFQLISSLSHRFNYITFIKYRCEHIFISILLSILLF